MRSLGHVARLALIGAALIVTAASAGTKTEKPAVGTYQNPNQTPPPPQAMDPALSLGLWKSSFGAVKIENNDQVQGGIHGVWVYDREGQEVIGYFAGTLRGNVLDFTWQEPGDGGAPLVGAGYLVFDTAGARFAGRWWTQQQDRVGEWTGWRQEPTSTGYGVGGSSYGGAAYGGAGYGDDYQPPPPPDDY